MGIFLSNLGGSVSVLDLTDGQQNVVTGTVHTLTDCFSIDAHTRMLSSRRYCFQLLPPSLNIRRQLVTQSELPYPPWVATAVTSILSPRSICSHSWHKRRPATSSFLWGIEKRKMIKMEKSLKFLLTWKNSIINEIYKNHSFKFFLI